MKRRKRVQIKFTKPSMTEQHHKDSCDMTKIIERYNKTGFHRQDPRQMSWGDFAQVSSYQDALNLVLETRDSFLQLDSGIRKRFQNDPHKFLSFIDDPKNYDEAVKIGLISPEIEKPIEVKVVNKKDENDSIKES